MKEKRCVSKNDKAQEYRSLIFSSGGVGEISMSLLAARIHIPFDVYSVKLFS